MYGGCIGVGNIGKYAKNPFSTCTPEIEKRISLVYIILYILTNICHSFFLFFTLNKKQVPLLSVVESVYLIGLF